MTPPETNHATTDAPAGEPAVVLPAWLQALDAEPAPTPLAAAVAPLVAAEVAPAAAAPTPAALLGEEDLPSWLRALTAEPSGSAAAAPPMRAVGPAALPAWAAQTEASGPVGPVADASLEEPPQVWGQRAERPQPEAKTGAAIFASLAGADVSGTPAEPELQSLPAPPPHSLPPYWYAVAALVVLLVIAAVAAKLLVQ